MQRLQGKKQGSQAVEEVENLLIWIKGKQLASDIRTSKDTLPSDLTDIPGMSAESDFFKASSRWFNKLKKCLLIG